jgi:hypothetical protein
MQEVVVKLFEFLGRFEPVWVTIILLGLALIYQSPKLLKNFFDGLRGLRKDRQREMRLKRKENAQPVVPPGSQSASS